jgi:hypothetical protein
MADGVVWRAGAVLVTCSLLFIILLSNLTAIFLQYLSLKLGIAGERDLAQACAHAYSPLTAYALWLGAELAIIACDLAEVIGSALALNLLFNAPLWLGVLLTGADVLLLLVVASQRWVERLVALLTALIGLCFAVEMGVCGPDWSGVGWGLVSAGDSVQRLSADTNYLYLAIAIVGATVMPHNLYLHSSIVQTRYGAVLCCAVLYCALCFVVLCHIFLCVSSTHSARVPPPCICTAPTRATHRAKRWPCASAPLTCCSLCCSRSASTQPFSSLQRLCSTARRIRMWSTSEMPPNCCRQALARPSLRYRLPPPPPLPSLHPSVPPAAVVNRVLDVM